ncbi:hypothetical protein QBE52_04560 [Clostridiaceae bacterium 35-E11]
MKNTTGKAPSLKNSKAVGQGEIQSVKQDINTTTGQGMTSGIAPSLNSSNAVGQGEMQNVRNKVQKSGNKNPNNKGLM